MMRDMALDDAVAWLARPGPCLVFMGAGVSSAAPTCAPGVWPVVRQTIDLIESYAGLKEPSLADSLVNVDSAVSPLDREFSQALKLERPEVRAGVVDGAFRSRVLPESCYAAIAAAYGTDRHLGLWSAFAWVGEEDGGSGPPPNLAHLLAVYLAAQGGVPILTTNFDCFLEAAVRRLALRPVVGLPRRRGFATPRAMPGEVAVWKLHGSATDPSTIASHSSDLARGSFRALHRQFPVKPARLLIAGYSGSDLDVFPWLRESFADVDTLWVDSEFKAGHKSSLMETCQRFEGDISRLAEEFWSASRLERESPETRRAVGSAQGSAGSTQFRQAFAERVAVAVDGAISPILAGDQTLARIALAGTLASVADFPQVAAVLEGQIPRGSGEVRGLLMLASAYENMDRHPESGTLARSALAKAARGGDVFGFGRAELALSYSILRNHVSTFPRQARVAGFVYAGRLLADACAFAPLFWLALAKIPSRRRNRSHYDAIDFAGDYVENLIRLAGMILMLTRRFPTRMGGAIENTAWWAIERMAHASGYMRGLLNVRKYRARRDGASGFELAQQSAAMVGDAVAAAISERDAAVRIIGDAGDDDGARSKALGHLEASIKWSAAAGCPSLILKVLLIASEAGLGRSLLPDGWQPPDGIRSLAAMMTGKADQRAAEMLSERLLADDASHG